MLSECPAESKDELLGAFLETIHVDAIKRRTLVGYQEECATPMQILALTLTQILERLHHFFRERDLPLELEDFECVAGYFADNLAPEEQNGYDWRINAEKSFWEFRVFESNDGLLPEDKVLAMASDVISRFSPNQREIAQALAGERDRYFASVRERLQGLPVPERIRGTLREQFKRISNQLIPAYISLLSDPEELLHYLLSEIHEECVEQFEGPDSAFHSFLGDREILARSLEKYRKVLQVHDRTIRGMLSQTLPSQPSDIVELLIDFYGVVHRTEKGEVAMSS